MGPVRTRGLAAASRSLVAAAVAAGTLSVALLASPPALAAASCGITPAQIKSALGITVSSPLTKQQGPTTVCTYANAKTGQSVIATVVKGVSGNQLRQFSAPTSIPGAKVTTVKYHGLGVPALAYKVKVGGLTESGIVALKGSIALEALGPAPLPKLAKLVKQALPSV